MIIKFFGLIIGIILVIGLWYWLDSDKNRLEGNKVVSEQTDDSAKVESPDTTGADDETSGLEKNDQGPDGADHSGEAEATPPLTPESGPGEVEQAGEPEDTGIYASGTEYEEETGESQVFWEPFNTPSKARGFAEYVSSESGVPCRVIKEAPAVYRIFFKYRDETDRMAKIALIETKVGIRLGLEGSRD